MVPLDLYAGFQVVLEARDPATGVEFTDVALSKIVLYSGHPGQPGDLLSPQPLYLHLAGT